MCWTAIRSKTSQRRWAFMLIQKGNQYIWMRFERWNLLDCLTVTAHQAGPLQWCDWRGANYKEDIKQWCFVVLLKGNVSLVPKKQTSQHQKQIVSSLLWWMPEFDQAICFSATVIQVITITVLIHNHKTTNCIYLLHFYSALSFNVLKQNGIVSPLF